MEASLSHLQHNKPVHVLLADGSEVARTTPLHMLNDTVLFISCDNHVLKLDARAGEGPYHRLLPGIQEKYEAWKVRDEENDREMARIQEIEETIEGKVTRSARLRKFLILSGLGLEFGVLFYFVFEVYSWDVMEPFSYFLGTGWALLAATYFSLTKRMANYPSFVQNLMDKKKDKLLRQAGVDGEDELEQKKDASRELEWVMEHLKKRI